MEGQIFPKTAGRVAHRRIKARVNAVATQRDPGLGESHREVSDYQLIAKTTGWKKDDFLLEGC